MGVFIILEMLRNFILVAGVLTVSWVSVHLESDYAHPSCSWLPFPIWPKVLFSLFFLGSYFRIWQILTKHTSHPKMSVAKPFLVLCWHCLPQSLTACSVLFNYTTSCGCVWSPCLIQCTERCSLRAGRGSVMKGATCLIRCRYQKRPGGKRGWAHRSALENWVLACLGLPASESFVTSNKLLGS